ncbi:sigma-E factor negative regulatory protein [Thalassotalea piscium]|uniref:Anti-sigma-E factor RseA n=1 Tax=Thalassotalea piscium TaxID=1230533 RepID=A0A7X0TT09_9GAMM|nr:RseA family anti-sigma factor [Thalassotalea piscium]MBB6542701.1 sigma-E factor negative regulatory protein RseA [Thalassotalea piscium]
MSESKFETVSSLVDGYQMNDEAFEQTINDTEMSETWDNYQLIGDVLRDEANSVISTDLSSQIAQAIADEPTVLAPKKQDGFTSAVKAQVIKFAKPFGQMAIAASAAGLMVIGVQQNVAENDTLVPNQVVQTTPLGGIAEPVSLNFQTKGTNRNTQEQAFAEQQRRFQALLHDHQQQVKLTALVNAPQQPEIKAEDKPK